MHTALPTASLLMLLAATLPGTATADTCLARTGATRTPVVELYTSEGCSSCPPADRWLSTLKGQPVVAQAFHVGYWDYIGWVDRFASPAHTTRQRQVAAANGLRNIYTPQVVRNGQDWREYSNATAATEPARAAITLRRTAGNDNFEATVTPDDGTGHWTAYWTVTEHGHSSCVKSGENAGAFLQHDFVVRQYTPVGSYRGAQTLPFAAIAAHPQHPRQINLVVADAPTGRPLQAVSLSCGGPAG